MKKIIAYRIKNARKLKLLSQQEVADEIGVSKHRCRKTQADCDHRGRGFLSIADLLENSSGLSFSTT